MSTMLNFSGKLSPVLYKCGAVCEYCTPKCYSPFFRRDMQFLLRINRQRFVLRNLEKMKSNQIEFLIKIVFSVIAIDHYCDG